MNTSRGAVVAYSVLGKFLSVIGYIGAFTFFVAAFALLSESEPEGFIVGLVFTAVFIFLIVKGSQLKRRNKRFKRYIHLISKERITSLTGLASRTKRKVEFVRKDLQKMIDRKYFLQAHIDYQRDEILIGSQDGAEERQPVQQTPIVTETVKCSGCGAANARQKGKIINCEYCGSLIG